MIHLICGKICSGKTYFAKRLSREKNAVILSCDELSRTIDRHISLDSGAYDILARDLQKYLLDRAADIGRMSVDVILDWGFWTAAQRAEVSAFFREKGLEFCWYYMDIDDISHKRNIEKRNSYTHENEYYVDEGLLSKCLSRFEEPYSESMVRIVNT